MEEISNEDFTQAVDHISTLLVDEDLVRTSSDEAALLSAMARIAHKLAAIDPFPSPLEREEREEYIHSRARTPESGMSRTMGKIADIKAKWEGRMDQERRRQYQEVVSSMRDKPQIDSKSRLLAKKQPPLYQRASELLLRKKEKIRDLQYKKATETLKKQLNESGFKDKNREKTTSNRNFQEHVVIWMRKKDANLAALQQEKALQEEKTLKSRPSISPYSRKLSAKVGFT